MPGRKWDKWYNIKVEVGWWEKEKWEGTEDWKMPSFMALTPITAMEETIALKSKSFSANFLEEYVSKC